MSEDADELARSLQSSRERSLRCPLCLRRAPLTRARRLQRLLRRWPLHNVPQDLVPLVAAACQWCESRGRAALGLLSALQRAGRLQDCFRDIARAPHATNVQRSLPSLCRLRLQLVSETLDARGTEPGGGCQHTDTLHVDIAPGPSPSGQVVLVPQRPQMVLVTAPDGPSAPNRPIAPKGTIVHNGPTAANQQSIFYAQLADGIESSGVTVPSDSMLQFHVISGPSELPPLAHSPPDITPRIVTVRGGVESPETIFPDDGPPVADGDGGRGDNGDEGGQCTKQPLANGARVDWEDKIPMDVISFMDATDPNAASYLPAPLKRAPPPAPSPPPPPPLRKAPPRGRTTKGPVSCVIDLC